MTAQPDVDYVNIAAANGITIMNNKQKTAEIQVKLISDDKPEEAKVFYVNITDAEYLPTSDPSAITPRVSSKFGKAKITILPSDDPYGIFSFSTPVIQAIEAPNSDSSVVSLKVVRAGGNAGAISVNVKSIGKGETWLEGTLERLETENPPLFNEYNDVNEAVRAEAGQDYIQLDATIYFKEGEIEKDIQLVIPIDRKTRLCFYY